MKTIVFVFLLLAACCILAGCTTTSSPGVAVAREDIRAVYQYHDDWSPGLGCYGRVTGYIYNARNSSAENIVLNLNLVDTRTGSIRDSRSIFAGTMGAGQSVPFESTLDGDCFKDYRVDAIVSK